MQALLASLVVSMGVKDAAYKAGMANARSEAQRTGQQFDASGKQMSSAMERAANDVERAMRGIVTAVVDAGQKVRAAGLTMTAAITLPLAAVAKVSKDAASDFQAAMNSVHSAMLSASPAELNKLRDAALQLGPAVGRSSLEAANAIADLARNGLSAADILGGGLQSALTLAVVGQTDLGTAADLTSDILSQFGKSAADLPSVVNKVSGALDVSKLGMDDYKLAIGQVGGVAGGLGYTFDDLNTALAATSSFFDSGSDAGTSFKTFLLALNPQSKDAATTMEKLGITTKEAGNRFFDANKQAKSLADVAEVLKTAFAGLNDQSTRTGLTNIFGSDGMRTAIALMKEGAKGIQDTQAAIDKVTADQKTTILLDGEAAATQRVASAWQNLKIQIGNAGILQAFTAIKDAIADVLTVLGSAPPWFYKLAAVVGVAAAAFGPMVVILTTIGKIALPLLLLRLGPIGLAFSALVNPIGFIVRLLGQLALQAGAATVLGVLGSRLVAFAGPIGIAISLLSIFVPLLLQSATASTAMMEAVDAANSAQQKATGTAAQLATATGKAKDETLALAQAQRIQAVQAIATAKSNMVAARAAFAAAQAATADAVKNASGAPISYGGGGSGAGVAVLATSHSRDQAMQDYKASQDALRGQLAAFDTLDAAIKKAQAPAPKPRNIDFDAAKKARTDKGRDTDADAADYAAKLAEAHDAELDAQADLTGSVEARYRATMSHLDSERADYAHQLQSDQGITSAQADILMASKDRELATRRMAAEQDLTRGLVQQDYDMAKERNDSAQELTRGESDLADTASQKLAADLRLLDLQRQQEDADLDLILATKDSASAEYSNAQARKGQLDAVYSQRREQTSRQDAGPLAGYLRSLPTDAAKANEALQGVAVDGLKGITDGIAGAITGAKSLASAFKEVAASIIADLAKIAIEKTIVGTLGNAISKFVGGGVSLSSLSSPGLGIGSGADATLAMPTLDLSSFGGGKASGGGISPSKWYMVGEEGPEIFAPGTSGTIIPNGGLGAGPSSQRVEIVPSPWFDVRAAGAAAPGIQQMGVQATLGGSAMAQDAIARRGRQRLGR